MKKTVRFADLVRTSGRPQVTTLWTDPRRDRVFSKAIRETRVLTVMIENVGSKRDAGRIGFHKEKNAAYLVFPEELPRNPNARVVGIKYDQLALPKESRTEAVAEPKARKLEREKESPKQPARGPKNFS